MTKCVWSQGTCEHNEVCGRQALNKGGHGVMMEGVDFSLIFQGSPLFYCSPSGSISPMAVLTWRFGVRQDIQLWVKIAEEITVPYNFSWAWEDLVPWLPCSCQEPYFIELSYSETWMFYSTGIFFNWNILNAFSCFFRNCVTMLTSFCIIMPHTNSNWGPANISLVCFVLYLDF